MSEEILDAQTVISESFSAMARLWTARAYDAVSYPPSSSEIAIASERGTVTVTLLDAYSGDIPDKLSDAIAWLQGYLKSVPVARRDSATLDIETGEYSADVRITYKRPETNTEWKARKTDVARRAALAQTRAEERERAEFERLKAKFDHTI